LSNVLELKKAIFAFLAIKSSRVFDYKAPPNINYPYVTFILENSDTDDNQKMEIFELTIDIYDNNLFDWTVIDMLENQIDGDGSITSATGLHRKHYYEAGVLRFESYRYMRDIIEEKENNVIHKQLTYDIYAYL
jgi:hypothetical protein